VTAARSPRNAALDAVVWASTALAVGSALLAIGHMGVQIPLLSALGPGGTRAVVPAAIAFSLGACLHGAVAYGVARRLVWAWPLGVLAAGVTLLGAAMPFRGVGSLIGMSLAGLQLGILLTGTARRTMLRTAQS
jgi:hypothetical protein